MNSPDPPLDGPRWPTVAVVIPTRERHQLLLGSLQSVLTGDLQPDEILVVDQSDQALDPVRLPLTATPVRYMWSSERGLSRGRNTGIRATACEVIAFVDDDMLVEAGWLRDLTLRLVQGGHARVVTGSVISGDPERPDGFAPSIKADPGPLILRGRPANDHLSPNNMALWRHTFADVGLFDERLGAGSRYPSSEDNDLCFRLLEAGYEIEYVPEILGIHRAWRGTEAVIPLAWRYGIGQGAYWAKYFSLRDRYMLRRAGQDAARHVWRAIVTARRDLRSAIADGAYVAGLVLGASAWLALERWRRRGGAVKLERL